MNSKFTSSMLATGISSSLNQSETHQVVLAVKKRLCYKNTYGVQTQEVDLRKPSLDVYKGRSSRKAHQISCFSEYQPANCICRGKGLDLIMACLDRGSTCLKGAISVQEQAWQPSPQPACGGFIMPQPTCGRLFYPVFRVLIR